MKKKVIGILTVSALILSMVAPAVSVQAESDDPVTIRFYCTYGEADPQWPPTERILEKFAEDNPNITVELERQSSTQYHEKLAEEIAADTLTNVFMHWGGSEIREAVISGKVLDLTELIDADPELKEQFSESTWNGFNVVYDDIDGIYGIPVSSLSAGFYYNTELFEQAGITEPPKTFEELDEAIEKLSAIDTIPWVIGCKDGWRVEHVYSALVYRLNGVKSTRLLADRELTYSDEVMIRPWEMIRKWADDGAFGPEPASVDFATEQSIFQSGKAAMNFSLSPYTTLFDGDASPIQGKVGFFTMPIFSDHEEYANNNFAGGDIALGIATNASDAEIAASYKLARAITSKEGATEYVKVKAFISPNMETADAIDLEDELYRDFTELVTKADDCCIDVSQYDTVPTLLTKIRDTASALVNNQLTPEEAGAEIDAEIADYED